MGADRPGGAAAIESVLRPEPIARTPLAPEVVP